MKTKFCLLFVLAFIAVIALNAMALADQWYEYSEPDINEMTVYVDGEMVWYGYCMPDVVPDRWTCYTYQYGTPSLERGSTTDVRVSFISNVDLLEEVTVHTWITGYHEDIEAETPQFDVFGGNLYTRTLHLKIPIDLDARAEYTLYVQIEHQQDLSGIDEANVDTEIQRISNIIEILSVELYNSEYRYMNSFKAGDTVYIDTVVKNRGNYEAEDVYVRASINELGIERTIYVGDLEPNDDDDDEDSKEVTVALFLPSSLKAGSYTLEVKAYNDEVSDDEIRSIIIEGYKGGAEEEQPEGKVDITGQITSNEVEQGEGAVYTILVANFDSITQNFIVETTGTEGWATTTITPQTFTLAPGQSKLVNVYLAAGENAVEGEHVFSAKIRYGSESKQYNLIANVKKSTSEINWKTILMIVGIVLAAAIVVLLIILLTTRHRHKTTTETAESYY
ncbi:MAG: hypothetical protein ACPLXC_01540 [Candidatus Pacearchaeota archaeon]